MACISFMSFEKQAKKQKSKKNTKHTSKKIEIKKTPSNTQMLGYAASLQRILKAFSLPGLSGIL